MFIVHHSSSHRGQCARLALVVALALAGILLPGRPVQADCTGTCGDANSTNTVTTADFVYLFTYLFKEGPAPAADCGDCDLYKLTTVRDLLRVNDYVFAGGPPPICPPIHPPIVSSPSSGYVLLYNNVFPANQTTVQMNISLQMNPAHTMRAYSLPLSIEVGGQAPTLDTVVLPNGQQLTGYGYSIGPGGTPSNVLLLGMYRLAGSFDVGTHLIATVQLSMPASGVDRPITIEWTTTPPMEAGQNVNYPMLLDSDKNAWRPLGVGTGAATSSIAGTVFEDLDGDCVRDSLEPGLRGYKIHIPPPTDYLAITDAQGHYSFPELAPGIYTLEQLPRPLSTLMCPPGTGTHTQVVGANETWTGFDFGDSVVNAWDLVVSASAGPLRPGFVGSFGIHCINLGNLGVTSDLEFELPPQVSFVNAQSSPNTPFSFVPGSPDRVVWNGVQLNPGEEIWLRVTGTVDVGTPLGTLVCGTATAEPSAGDADASNNSAVVCREVQGSFDPNAKYVTPPGSGPYFFVQREDTLLYHVDFQNTGTDTAFTVVVRDTLDPSFDIATLQPGGSSHPFSFSMAGRELTWTFSNILLPDSFVNEPLSHGYFEYSVLAQQSAADGTVLFNSAGIYFDFNPPVITDDVMNTICPDATPGDVNGDLVVTSSDVITLVNFVFKGGAAPPTGVGDINCNGSVTSADIILLVNYIFKGGPAPCDPC